MTCTVGDWYSAKAACIAKGEILATVTSQEMNDWITARADEKNVWIAANDITDEGVWTNDGFKNWQSGEPNNSGDEDCGLLVTPTGKWMDMPCANTYPCFVCQRMYIFVDYVFILYKFPRKSNPRRFILTYYCFYKYRPYASRGTEFSYVTFY